MTPTAAYGGGILLKPSRFYISVERGQNGTVFVAHCFGPNSPKAYSFDTRLVSSRSSEAHALCLRRTRVTARPKKLPFENRWTSGEKALHWYLQLEREGVEKVRLQYAMQDIAASSGVEATIPREFISVWLNHHARVRTQKIFLWRVLIFLLVLLAAIAAFASAWFAERVYETNVIRNSATVEHLRSDGK